MDRRDVKPALLLSPANNFALGPGKSGSSGPIAIPINALQLGETWRWSRWRRSRCGRPRSNPASSSTEKSKTDYHRTRTDDTLATRRISAQIPIYHTFCLISSSRKVRRILWKSRCKLWLNILNLKLNFSEKERFEGIPAFLIKIESVCKLIEYFEFEIRNFSENEMNNR